MIPIHIQLRDGESRLRYADRIDHGTLCRLSGLDPVRTVFDLPQSMLDGVRSWSGRVVEGYALIAGEPVAKITIEWEGRKFRDVDPEKEWDRS
jgi:hypothetical protein